MPHVRVMHWIQHERPGPGTARQVCKTSCIARGEAEKYLPSSLLIHRYTAYTRKCGSLPMAWWLPSAAGSAGCWLRVSCVRMSPWRTLLTFCGTALRLRRFGIWPVAFCIVNTTGCSTVRALQHAGRLRKSGVRLPLRRHRILAAGRFLSINTPVIFDCGRGYGCALRYYVRRSHATLPSSAGLASRFRETIAGCCIP